MRGANNLKELDTRKYGGYKGGEKAYFVLVKYCIEKALKKKVKKSIIWNSLKYLYILQEVLKIRI